MHPITVSQGTDPSHPVRETEGEREGDRERERERKRDRGPVEVGGRAQFSTRRRITAHIHLLLQRIVYSVRVIGQRFLLARKDHTLPSTIYIRGCRPPLRTPSLLSRVRGVRPRRNSKP